MATKKKMGVTKNLNAPKMTTWMIALIVTIVGAILFVMGLTGIGWAGTVGAIALLLASALLLIATYVRGL